MVQQPYLQNYYTRIRPIRKKEGREYFTAFPPNSLNNVIRIFSKLSEQFA